MHKTLANRTNFGLPKTLDFVPASNIWNFLRLANQIRKFARLLQCNFLSEILNCLLEFIVNIVLIVQIVH